MLKRATAQPVNGFVRLGILNPPTIVDLSVEEADMLVKEIIDARSAILKEQPFPYQGTPVVKQAICATTITRAIWPA